MTWRASTPDIFSAYQVTYRQIRYTIFLATQSKRLKNTIKWFKRCRYMTIVTLLILLWFIDMEVLVLDKHIYIYISLTFPVPIPYEKKKFIFTLLCGPSEGFMKTLKAGQLSHSLEYNLTNVFKVFHIFPTYFLRNSNI